ncbi:MAG: electron transfer flavoprotein subunit alpha/FixB family protein [Peptoniphilus sp.]|nr:electron transfer flavoprotein subunit alpha/FixB family protein [Peptoniphilus sp.]
MYKDIMVVCFVEDGEISSIAAEIMGRARYIADKLSQNVQALLIGDDVSKAAERVIGYGADKAIKVEDPNLKGYRTLTFTKVLDEAIEEFKPFAVLIPASRNGRDLGGRISARRNIGLVADCSDIEVDEEKQDIKWIRPTFDGQLFSDIRISTFPKIGTIGDSVFKSPAYDSSRKGEIVDFSVEITQEDLLTEILGMIKKFGSDKDVSQASIVVAGGLGLKEPNNLYIIKDLANVLGAAVSGSKPLADQLWIPQDSFIGMSGLKIKPKLYIAIGISGSAQHIQGMRDSGLIISINNDPKAPIFKESHCCIVADLFEFVPKLTAKIKEIKGL